MKKIFMTLVAAVMAVAANAFELDGIDLNGTVTQITREVSKKGYVLADEKPNALKGYCQGTLIYLTFNYDDVMEKGHCGQVTIDVPASSGITFAGSAMLLNVIYHQTKNNGSSYTYSVDSDGTTLTLSQGSNGVQLTYTTPYYKAK